MTFTVSPGQVTGFIGSDGAGKSTTMRVILGLDAPDSGHALIGGHPNVSRTDPLTQVGALLDAAALQPSRTAPARRMASRLPHCCAAGGHNVKV
jgi:ABC-2 type transport system ATP-binding protein